MEWTEREALRKCRLQLCHDLQIVELIAILEACGAVTSVERQQINAERTNFEKNGKLIDILSTKGPEAFNAFIEALSATGQRHIATSLISTKNDGLPSNIALANASSASETLRPQTGSLPHAVGKDTVDEFDAASEVDKIIKKFKQLPKEKATKLKQAPLTDSLSDELKQSRRGMTTIELEDLVNIYMCSVFTDATTKKIRSTNYNSNGFYDFWEALLKSNIYGLITFLIGLKETNQVHYFGIFCSEEFCKELLSILN